MRKLSTAQRWLLESVREATDMETSLHKSRDATVKGLVARGSTIDSLERRGLVRLGGFCVEVDGDGFAKTGNDDAPYYEITSCGRRFLAEHPHEWVTYP